MVAAVAVAALVVVFGGLAIAGVFSGDGDDEGGPEAGADFGITAPEPPKPPPQPTTTRIPVAIRADSIAAGAGFVWASDSFSGSAVRINPRSRIVREFQPSGFPTAVAAGEGAAWLALPDRGAVQRVAPSGEAAEPEKTRGFPFQIAAGEGAVWAMSQNSIERIDPASGRPDPSPTRLEGPGASVAAGEGWVWVTRGNREVVRINPDDGELEAGAARVSGAFSVTVGEGAVWALGAPPPGPGGGPPPTASLVRIDAESGREVGDPVRIPQALDVAAGLGYVWVSSGDGTVRRIEPDSGFFIGGPIDVGRVAQSIAVGEGAVWVADPGGRAVTRIRP